MALSEEQLIERTKANYSSDMASIMNVGWNSPYDVWLEKTGKVKDFKPTDVMRLGNMLEGPILDEAERSLGTLLRDAESTHKVCPEAHLGAHIDAVVSHLPEDVEAKTSGILWPVEREGYEWGEEGTDQVPVPYTIQTHVHMICSGHERCHLVALLGGRGFVFYMIKKDPDLADMIANASIDFWEKHVKTDTPPEIYEPSLKVLKRVKRVPNKMVPMPHSLFVDKEISRALNGMAKKYQEHVDAAILKQLGDAECGVCEQDPNLLMEYYETHRKGYTVEPTDYRKLGPKGTKEIRKAVRERVSHLPGYLALEHFEQMAKQLETKDVPQLDSAKP